MQDSSLHLLPQVPAHRTGDHLKAQCKALAFLHRALLSISTKGTTRSEAQLLHRGKTAVFSYHQALLEPDPCTGKKGPKEPLHSFKGRLRLIVPWLMETQLLAKRECKQISPSKFKEEVLKGLHTRTRRQCKSLADTASMARRYKHISSHHVLRTLLN